MVIFLPMNTLPYEILQLVATWLLPRYQCRFALTSRQNYDCLYSPLLRWCAKRRRLATPRYRIVSNTVAISEHNNTLIVYDHDNALHVINLTTCNTIVIRSDVLSYKHCCAIDIDYYTGAYINGYIVEYNIEIFDNYYKYMHAKIFKLCATIHTAPLLSLPSKILYKIIPMAEVDYDLSIIHVYLRSVAFYRRRLQI